MFDINNIDLEHLTFDQKLELMELLEKRADYLRFNKIERFEPYPFQQKFYKASAKHKSRFLCAGNRCGKTFSEAAEFSYHATGLYPDGWEGHKFIKSEMKTADGQSNPHDLIMWCVGITGDSTRKVLQKELFGTESAKDTDSIGTGAIPRHCIDMDKIERDGHKILVAKIKHHDPNGVVDGYTTIEFRSTQQGEHVLMGSTVDYIWLDRFFFVLHTIG